MRKIILLLLLCFASLSLAQESLDPKLVEQIDGLENSTETLRGLSAGQDVPLAFPTRVEVGDYLASSFAEYYTPEIVAQEMAFYSAFGFIPADYDFVAGLTALYSEQVAGYYDTESQSMNVIMSSGDAPTSFLPLLDQLIYVHEYTHALQDQNFDMDAFLGDSAGDAYLARLSLIEGDATAVMSLYTTAVARANPFMTLLQLGSGLAQLGNVTLPADTPAIIGAELNFPYIEGQAFVSALVQDGGWEAVNAAYRDNPPLSTEQILHPERYLAGDTPMSISFETQLDGWEAVKSGVFGEFYLREWLRAQGLTGADLNLAATGWGGDNYQVFSSATGTAFALELAFDTEQDQAEFLAALNSLELETLFVGDVITCWQGEAILCMALYGETLRLSSAPDEASARLLAGS